jgi:hypothetical protein
MQNMLVILADMAAIWFLLNIFTEENWDDKKLTILGIVLAISVLGGLATRQAVPYVGVFPAHGAYFVIGTICL